jgi:amino acid adenylation domain-containing protein
MATATTLLQHYLTRSADRHPEKVAMVLGDERLTYGELDAASTRLAHALIEAGCRRGDRVCLLLSKSPWAVASMLGVLKADCAYVPVDLQSPTPRVARIVESADPVLALVDVAGAQRAAELTDDGILGPERRCALIDDSPGDRLNPVFRRSDLNALSPEPRVYRNGPDDLAHLLFTSGSTGLPKGVMITHSNVRNFVDWGTSYFGFSAGDRLSGHPPLHFDLSTFDIYGCLCVGAELHLLPAEANLLPTKLADYIRDQQLVQWFSVPSTMTLMTKVAAVREGDFPQLQRVLWCGEVLPTPILIDWMQKLPHVRFTNLYGPTEATIASSYYTVVKPPRDATEPIPIGRPCPGEELAVLDEELRWVPDGEIGALHIGGVGLSPGYWRDEEKTRGAFLPHPRIAGERIYSTGDLGRRAPDGEFHFVGRTDSQIKSRGYRIELGEIESALGSLDGLKECAVVGVDAGGLEGTAICCAYASADGAVTVRAIRKELKRVLPSYMLPTQWLTLKELPKNQNGKIDRRSLREMFARREPQDVGAAIESVS